MSVEQEGFSDKNKMETRMQEIAYKDRVTPSELKELAYLVWDIDLEQEDVGQYCGDYYLPTRDKPELVLHPNLPGEDSVDITILDGLGEGTGEIIRLANEEGELWWRVGVWDSYHSRFFGRGIVLENPEAEPLLSEKPLTDEECAKVAKILFDAYKRSELVPTSA